MRAPDACPCAACVDAAALVHCSEPLLVECCPPRPLFRRCERRSPLGRACLRCDDPLASWPSPTGSGPDECTRESEGDRGRGAAGRPEGSERSNLGSRGRQPRAADGANSSCGAVRGAVAATTAVAARRRGGRAEASAAACAESLEPRRRHPREQLQRTLWISVDRVVLLRRALCVVLVEHISSMSLLVEPTSAPTSGRGKGERAEEGGTRCRSERACPPMRLIPRPLIAAANSTGTPSRHRRWGQQKAQKALEAAPPICPSRQMPAHAGRRSDGLRAGRAWQWIDGCGLEGARVQPVVVAGRRSRLWSGQRQRADVHLTRDCMDDRESRGGKTRAARTTARTTGCLAACRASCVQRCRPSEPKQQRSHLREQTQTPIDLQQRTHSAHNDQRSRAFPTAARTQRIGTPF